MAQAGSYSSGGGYRRACGRTRRYYIKRGSNGLWLVVASADTEVALVTALERARAMHPEATLRVDEYRRDGERIEGDRQEPVAAARAA